MNLRTREQWGASYDVTQRPPMSLPAPDLWIHHTVTVPSDDPDADMRSIEAIDIGRFGYPSYSYVIHPSGTVLEGMGTHIGAHTLNHNSTSFGVSFIGNFENDTPTDAAMEACRELVAYLHGNGALAPGDQPTGGHRDVYATACPGANLYPRIPELRLPPEEDMPLTTDDLTKIAQVLRSEGVSNVVGVLRNESVPVILSALAGVTVDPQKVANALAPLLSASVQHLTADDLAAIAKAVNDEEARRQAS